MRINKFCLFLFLVLYTMPAFAEQTITFASGKSFVIPDEFKKSAQMSSNIGNTYVVTDNSAFIQVFDNLGENFNYTREELEHNSEQFKNDFIGGIERSGTKCSNVSKLVSQTETGYSIMVLNYDMHKPSNQILKSVTYIIFMNGAMNVVTCAAELQSQYPAEFDKIGAQMYSF